MEKANPWTCQRGKSEGPGIADEVTLKTLTDRHRALVEAYGTLHELMGALNRCIAAADTRCRRSCGHLDTSTKTERRMEIRRFLSSL